MKREMWLLCLLALAGCGDSASEPIIAVAEPVPESFSTEGVTWTKAALTADAEVVLSKFFESHTQLAGSPDMEGSPEVFVSDAKDRRFYWRHPATDGVRWTCVRFENGKFIHAEGSGSPY